MEVGPGLSGPLGMAVPPLGEGPVSVGSDEMAEAGGTAEMLGDPMVGAALCGADGAALRGADGAALPVAEAPEVAAVGTAGATLTHAPTIATQATPTIPAVARSAARRIPPAPSIDSTANRCPTRLTSGTLDRPSIPRVHSRCPTGTPPRASAKAALLLPGQASGRLDPRTHAARAPRRSLDTRRRSVESGRWPDEGAGGGALAGLSAGRLRH